MRVNIDEIYQKLSWKNDLSIQRSGIEDAHEIKNLGVLILPILSADSKSVWENCAKVLIEKSNSELEPYLVELLKWLQDMNWPGADLIYERLLLFPVDEILDSLNICCSLASISNDTPWQMALNSLKRQIENEKKTGDGSPV